MVVMGAEDEAEATTWTGDAVVAPDVGEVTVTPANDIPASAREAINKRRAFLNVVLL